MKRRNRRLKFLAVLVASLAMAPAHAYAGNYEIVNNASGLRADVMWASMDRFQGVFLWPNNNSASQEFTLVRDVFSAKGDYQSQYFHIRAAHSGQCLMLDWRGGSFTNGTRVIQYPACQDREYLPSQWYHKWVIGNCNMAWQDCQLGAREVIVNRYTNRCLDADNGRGGAPGVQAALQQWDCITSPTQWNAGNQFWHNP